jgi:undecaprenyl-diphosphatase
MSRRPRFLLVYVGVGALLVVAGALVAGGGTVGAAEKAVFAAVNGLPEVLRWPMWVFQLLGLLGAPLVVAVGAVLLVRPRFTGGLRLAIAALALVPLKLYVEKGVLKQVVHRQRPGRTQDDPVLRDVPSAGDSFPSGHAIIAFALAVLLTPYLGRRGRVVVWTLAVLNGGGPGIPRRTQPAGHRRRRRCGPGARRPVDARGGGARTPGHERAAVVAAVRPTLARRLVAAPSSPAVRRSVVAGRLFAAKMRCRRRSGASSVRAMGSFFMVTVRRGRLRVVKQARFAAGPDMGLASAR